MAAAPPPASRLPFRDECDEYDDAMAEHHRRVVRTEAIDRVKGDLLFCWEQCSATEQKLADMEASAACPEEKQYSASALRSTCQRLDKYRRQAEVLFRRFHGYDAAAAIDFRARHEQLVAMTSNSRNVIEPLPAACPPADAHGPMM